MKLIEWECYCVARTHLVRKFDTPTERSKHLRATSDHNWTSNWHLIGALDYSNVHLNTTILSVFLVFYIAMEICCEPIRKVPSMTIYFREKNICFQCLHIYASREWLWLEGVVEIVRWSWSVEFVLEKRLWNRLLEAYLGQRFTDRILYDTKQSIIAILK